MGWNKIFQKSSKTSASQNNNSSNNNNNVTTDYGNCSSSFLKNDTIDLANQTDTPKLKKKSTFKSVLSSLSLKSSKKSPSTILNQSIISFGENPQESIQTVDLLNAEDKNRSKYEKNIVKGSIKDDEENVSPSSHHQHYTQPYNVQQPQTVSQSTYRSSSSKDEPLPIPSNLHPCPICNRTFVPVTLSKHVKICEKMTTKKRKIFDSKRQRFEGTDLALLPPKPDHMKTTPVKPIVPVVHQKKYVEQLQPPPTQPVVIPTNEQRRDSVPSKQETHQVHHKDPPKNVVKRNLAPVTDQCPHCDRFFGMKAYDRHVEWCKERRFTTVQNNKDVSLNVAKEKLQARTKYRPPPLKTKRGLNREKYSGYSFGDDTTQSVNEFEIESSKMHQNKIMTDSSVSSNMSKESSINSYTTKTSHNSMTSSTTSEGALSDSYDPFLSAKRQLEELFSPTSTSTPSNTNNTNHTNNVNLKKSKNYTQPTTSSISRASNLNSIKSSFKRTSSLRLPKTISPTFKPINTLFSNKKPTIQRGISLDDGPISTSFLKSSEFDEMPVKSAYVSPITTTNKFVQLRDPNSVLRRKSKTEIMKTSNNELSKTDSLAVFLKYEHDLSISPSLTEKEIKDKNNSFNKRLSNISSSSSTSIDNLNQPTPVSKTPVAPSPKTNTNQSIFLYSQNEQKNQNSIDPKLINLCDNLPINITKLSDNDNSSSSDSTGTVETTTSIKNELNNIQRNSTESRRLKRQLKLSKDNFLYDNYGSNNERNCDDNNSSLTTNEKNFNPLRQLSTDKLFDDFDLEEFITSFEDDEKFPIFKDYKEFIKNNNSNNNINNFRTSRESVNEIKSPIVPLLKSNSNCNNTKQSNQTNNIHSNHDSADEVENELNLLINEISISNCDINNKINNDSNSNKYDNEQTFETIPKPLIELSFAERELIQSVSDLDNFCESSSTMYPVDSDELSSVESFPLASRSSNKTGSKFSADSAYGSLSRQSPIEHITRPTRRTIQRSRQQSNGSSNNSTLSNFDKLPSSKLQFHQNRNENNNAVVSSSESENSLPPIQTQKMDLIPQKDKCNNNNNDMNTVNNNSNCNSMTSSMEFKMSKFCHECGNKFSVVQAKFCMECGVRRMILE